MTLIDSNIARQFDRLPPHSLEAEQAFLCAMMLADQRTFQIGRAMVCREAFYQADHQIIFDVLSSLFDRNKPIDAVAVFEELSRRGVLEEVGGKAYIAQILHSMPSAAHGMNYAAIINEHYTRRQLIALSNDILRFSYGPSDLDTADEIKQSAMERLAKIGSASKGTDFQSITVILEEIKIQMASGGAPSITTGFQSLDDATNGFTLGELWVIGGRPSMGKSTLAKQIAVRSAKAGHAAAIVSLEEGKHKMGRNLVSAESRVENSKIRNPNYLNQQEVYEIDSGMGRLAGLPLYLTDRWRSIADIRSGVTLLVARHSVKLVIVDYLQRVQAPGRDKIDRVGFVSESLSNLSKELGIVIVAPVQLNRGVEGRDEKRPNMSDLRESGQIEQDADGIILLYREDYYTATTPGKTAADMTGIAELILAKYRDGARGGVIKLKSNLKYQTFDNAEQQQETNPFFD